MKIAFNPSTVASLTTPPNNKDITFDLRGRNIFARGVKFYGTDTNTWRDIKINNVSIDSYTLDLRNGSNTTLTNTNGVVTINSTWRPVVDDLTSDSTTSSLSAKQGKVLKALIDGKSNSDHNHDGRYVRYYAVTTLDCNNLAAGLTAARISATNAAHTNCSAYLYISDVGTPFQIQIPDSNIPYIYKRYYGSGGWSGWFKLNAGYADSAGSVAWDNITGKPSSYTPSAHTHAWNSLTHSSTTENQAILTNGNANGWKLQTLNIARWDNAADNAHSHANKSVLDGITSALVNNWNTAYNFVSSITGADSRYVKKSGDTMSGVLTINTTNFGALTIKRNDDANDASIQFRGTSSVYGYIGLNNSTKDKQFLRWNSDTSRVYTILDTSSTYISNGKGVINGITIIRVDLATKLETARSIWGQSFDGTGNVSGFMKNVRGLIYGDRLSEDWSDGNNTHPWYGIDYRHCVDSTETGKSYTSISSYFGLYFKTGGSRFIFDGGNVGIGTTIPSYKLDVNGQIRASGFHHANINDNSYVLLAGGGTSRIKHGSTYYSTAIQFGRYVWLMLEIGEATNGIAVVPTNISNPTRDIQVMNSQLGNYSHSRHGRYRVAPNGVLYYVDGVAGMQIYTTICYVANS